MEKGLVRCNVDLEEHWHQHWTTSLHERMNECSAMQTLEFSIMTFECLMIEFVCDRRLYRTK